MADLGPEYVVVEIPEGYVELGGIGVELRGTILFQRFETIIFSENFLHSASTAFHKVETAEIMNLSEFLLFILHLVKLVVFI